MSVRVQLVKKLSVNLYRLVFAHMCYVTFLLNAVEIPTGVFFFSLLLFHKKKLFIQYKTGISFFYLSAYRFDSSTS